MLCSKFHTVQGHFLTVKTQKHVKEKEKMYFHVNIMSFSTTSIDPKLFYTVYAWKKKEQ